MTGLTKWTSKDVDAIFDAANRYSVGLTIYFIDDMRMELGLHRHNTLHIIL